MLNHIKHHWHHHLALWGLILATFLLGAGSASAYTRWHGHGYQPGPLPPQIALGAGIREPASWWLNADLVRIHNQGNSNSCVGQTLSTMEEIVQHERDSKKARWHKKFSAGFIWNQANGGQNVGVTYGAAFTVLTRQGDARLRDFPYDGSSGYWIRPSSLTVARAAPYRFVSWRSIANTDRQTMRYELRHGRPLAVAMPILESFYNHWRSSSWITGQYGTFYFWHSMTIIGYNPYGVELLNSWGPDWGDHGHAMLTWQTLIDAGAQIVVAQPRAQLAGTHIPKFGKGTIIRGNARTHAVIGSAVSITATSHLPTANSRQPTASR